MQEELKDEALSFKIAYNLKNRSIFIEKYKFGVYDMKLTLHAFINEVKKSTLPLDSRYVLYNTLFDSIRDYNIKNAQALLQKIQTIFTDQELPEVIERIVNDYHTPIESKSTEE